jgi:hypothetical protein
MALKRILHFFTFMFVLLCATACPLPHVLSEGWLDYDLAPHMRKRYSNQEGVFCILSFLQKIFSNIISGSLSSFKPLLLAAANNYAAIPLTSLSSTILLL